MLLVTELSKAIEKRLAEQKEDEEVIQITRRDLLGMKFLNFQATKVKFSYKYHKYILTTTRPHNKTHQFAQFYILFYLCIQKETVRFNYLINFI